MIVDFGISLHGLLEAQSKLKKQKSRRSQERLLQAQHKLMSALINSSEEFANHEPLLRDLLFCRSLDLFLPYISDLLGLIFAALPEMLKSDKTCPLSMVFEYSDIEELKSAIAEQKVLQLSFSGIKGLHTELKNTFNLILFPARDHLNYVSLLSEKRNLLVHNDGIINGRYLKHVPLASEHLNAKLTISSDELTVSLRFMLDAVARIDADAVKKFHLA